MQVFETLSVLNTTSKEDPVEEPPKSPNNSDSDVIIIEKRTSVQKNKKSNVNIMQYMKRDSAKDILQEKETVILPIQPLVQVQPPPKPPLNPSEIQIIEPIIQNIPKKRQYKKKTDVKVTNRKKKSAFTSSLLPVQEAIHVIE